MSRMGKRGLAGRAFTLLAAVSTIGLLFLGFTLASALIGSQEAHDVRAKMDTLSTAGPLRLFVAMIADDIARNDCQRVGTLAQNAFGPATTVAIARDGNLVCGTAMLAPENSLETVLPTPGGNTMRVKVEVKRS